ncbi:tetratricopeptide repeat protein [Vibrio alfacsensis]|uniref:tetratricopeptide repeat protein n=1 Tax=Vibrio alfacsensis TaxID=1074311 RepID=UPI002ADD57E3|nr:tetratricopeptide repeat protein [Vibrio alfacsensis]WQE75909.1 tetratricopeptide repeat protein [Vibrio alfacsensis]
MESVLSAINKALSELAEKDAPSALTKAEVPSVTKSKPWLWLVAGFSLSLAVGGWAVSQSPSYAKQDGLSLPNLADNTLDSSSKPVHQTAEIKHSPTSKVTPDLDEVVYTKPLERSHQVSDTVVVKPQEQARSQVRVQPKSHTPPQAERGVLTNDVQTPAVSVPNAVQKPVLLAQVNHEPKSLPAMVQESSMRIEQVELSHQQLAEKALIRADKAMDANDMKGALSAFNEALRYQPTNVEARQKLAALYFGKGDTREAYDILQAGINLDVNNQVLRLALSKLLVKANQPEAALSPLVHLPPMSSRDYLAMRAALAQKQKQNDIALESYQLLTQREPENARWWLGLGIQQERALEFKSAMASYQQALGKVGISNQSQAFIRDRLKLLQQLESAQ